MDHNKIGRLIYQLRQEKHLTQRQLAEQMHISDKTISKWERGLGCPDVSLLPDLSRIFNIELEKLLSGELQANPISVGNLKKMHFHVCPRCGNLIASMADAGISCCGKKLHPLEPKKADDTEKLSVELIENEYFITGDHPMTKAHYISFVALLSGDSFMLRKCYPEWGLQSRLPRIPYSLLLWYCTEDGLFYQRI